MNLASLPVVAAGHGAPARGVSCATRHYARECPPVSSRIDWRRLVPLTPILPTRAPAEIPTAAAPPPTPGDTAASGEIALVNQDRAAAGLPPLRESAELDKIATARAIDMAQNNYFSHYRPGDPVLAVLELLRADNVSFTWYGENIISESGLPPDRVLTYCNDWWMTSPERRANILSTNYGQIGVGEAVTGDRVIMVEDFTN